MKVKTVFTGSSETEHEIRLFLSYVGSLDDGVPLHQAYEDPDDPMLKVMTVGRNGTNDRYPGSKNFDDTGGFFDIRDSVLYMTDKAKGCITL